MVFNAANGCHIAVEGEWQLGAPGYVTQFTIAARGSPRSSHSSGAYRGAKKCVSLSAISK
jgi:hypothetical protein